MGREARSPGEAGANSDSVVESGTRSGRAGRGPERAPQVGGGLPPLQAVLALQPTKAQKYERNRRQALAIGGHCERGRCVSSSLISLDI
jgi:hypothetical protein